MPYDKLLRYRHPTANHGYVLTFCTARRRPILVSNEAAICAAQALQRTANLGYCESLAYVIMPDHVHWLVILSARCGLASLVAATKGEASRQMQVRASLSLPIWQPGYYEHQVRVEADLRQQARYLVANPLRAGLVAKLVDYPHWYAVWAAPPHGPAANGASGEELLW